jgi:protein-S-isoprenylcysteine O-methyltransferase Ste14
MVLHRPVELAPLIVIWLSLDSHMTRIPFIGRCPIQVGTGDLLRWGTIASMNALELKIPPPLIALFLAILMWFTPALAGSVAIPSSLRIGLALALFGLGQGIAVSGVVAFRRARTTLNPIKASSASALVRSGVFRFTRNPMYLGLLLALLAWTVFLSNPITLLFLPVYVLYINRFQITPEERVLTSLFGTEYSAYKENVRRWL